MEENKIIFSKFKILKLIVFLVIVISFSIFFANYIIDNEFRGQINAKIFNQDVYEGSLSTIEIDSENNPHIYAYDKYITILNKNTLTFYDEYAEEAFSLNINIINPIEESRDNYMAIAEKDGNKLYLINNTEIKWENTVDGNIYRVSVNEKGYVTVLMKNSLYKSIIAVYDLEGNELFKTFLRTSYALCAEVSDDNSYFAIGLVDYSGVVLKSMVKLISMQKVNEDSKDATLNQYGAESNVILNNIKFNSKNELICMFDSYIEKITPDSEEKIYDISYDYMLVDITLKDNIVIIKKENSGLFSYDYQVDLINTVGKSDSLNFLGNDMPRKLFSNDNIFCVMLNNEIKIINSNGWLLKKYEIKNDIQEIILSDFLIGIIYNNKIEIIKL